MFYINVSFEGWCCVKGDNTESFMMAIYNKHINTIICLRTTYTTDVAKAHVYKYSQLMTNKRWYKYYTM